MSKSLYFNNCIREIRQTVYGRDMRKPVADAIEQVKESSSRVTAKRLAGAEAELDPNVIDWVERVARTVYVNYAAKTDLPTNLELSKIRLDDYLMIDTKIGDNTQLISGDDYLLTLNGNGWAEDELNAGSYVVYDEVPHHETYFLVLRVSGGQEGGV